MPPAAVSLSELAQRLARKQSELEQVRQAYEARSAELARRRDDLLAQLRAVEAEIEAVRPLASATAPAPAAAPQAPAPQAAARATLTLPALLTDLVRAAGRPVTVKELAQEVVRGRFPTASRDIPQLVKNKVSELVKRGVFRRAQGQPGVVLARPQGGAPARPARAAAGGKKAASKGKAAPKPAPATETTAKRGRHPSGPRRL